MKYFLHFAILCLASLVVSAQSSNLGYELWSWDEFDLTLTPNQIDSGSHYISISSYREFSSSALKSNGSVWRINYNSFEVLTSTQVDSSYDWIQVSDGYLHTLGLKSDGTLWGWSLSFPTPVQIGSDNDWAKVSAGSFCSFAIKDNGTLWAKGDNWSGQLGDGTTTYRPSFVQIGIFTDWVDVSNGGDKTLGLRANGTIWRWGADTPSPILSPVQLGTSTDWAYISAAYDHFLAIKDNGTLWMWGESSNGHLGLGTTSNVANPTQIGLSNQWIMGSCGLFATAALKSDGSLWTWGGAYPSSPTLMDTLNNWKWVSSGMHSMIALKEPQVIPFSCGSSTISDYDGNSYATVQIGQQCWMKENMRTTHFPNGSSIVDGTGVGNHFGSNEKYFFHIDDNPSYTPTYGLQYTLNAAVNSSSIGYDNTAYQGVCPDGWHIPRSFEWDSLHAYLGGTGVAGGKMKQTGTTLWSSPNTGATNSSGFTTLPAGGSHGNGFHMGLGDFSWLLSSDVRIYTSYSFSTEVEESIGHSWWHASVRCLKNTAGIVAVDSIASINSSDAFVYASIQYDGGSEILAKGICWNTTGSPEFVNDFVVDTLPTFSYSAQIQGLSPQTTYYIRAFVTNSEGTSYSDQWTMETDPLISNPCLSYAGFMPTSSIELCAYEGASAAAFNYQLDANDNLIYVLHTESGPMLGNIIFANTSGSFYFNPSSMVYGQWYYISSVVGNALGGNNVDFTDTCLSVAAGTPVMWYEIPDVDAGTNETVCGLSYTLGASNTNGSGTWTCITIPSAQFSPSANDPNATVTIPGFNTANNLPTQTNVVLKWTVENGPCAIIDQVTIAFTPTPIANAGSDQVVAGLETFLEGNFYPNATGIWSGNGSFLNEYQFSTGVEVTDYGVYDFIWTVNLNGCVNSDTVVITFNSVSTPIQIIEEITPILCYGQSSGEITLNISGGVPPYAFIWSNGITTQNLSGLSAGVYSLTITDSGGNELVEEFSVSEPSAIEVTADITPNQCATWQGGGIDITVSGGTPPYSYLWNTGASTQDLDFIAGGTYELTLTDTNSCLFTGSYTVESSGAIEIEINVNDVLCHGDSTGSVEMIISGGYPPYIIEGQIYSDNQFQSLFSNTSDTAIFTDLIAGQLIAWIMDSVGCGNEAFLFIQEPELIEVFATITDASSAVAQDGGIELIVNGGTPPYTFVWSTGDTLQNLLNIPQSLYSILISDVNNCSMESTYTVNATFNPDPGWNIVNTGNYHTILIESSIPVSIDTIAISPGDFIGVFYSDSGNYICGGYEMYTGSNLALTAWGNDEYTATKDGFDSGEIFVWKIWQASTQTTFIANASYVQPPDFPNTSSFAVNGVSALASLIVTNTDTQLIQLNSGWSYISTYIDLLEPNVADLMSEVQSNLVIMKNGAGFTYWPVYSVNNIGNLVIGQAYQLNMIVPDTLACVGNALVPELTPFEVPAGWSMLGYLRQSPADISALLGAYQSSINLVKNNGGQPYWPLYGLNFIGNMIPGQGYMMNASSSFILTYPSNSAQLKNTAILHPEPVHYKQSINTGNTMNLCILQNAWNIIPNKGDELAVFNQSGILSGSGVYTGGHFALSIWQQDELFPGETGLVPGEEMQIRLWSQQTKTETELALDYFLQGSKYYETNGIAVVSSIRNRLDNQLEVSLFPNPSYDVLRIFARGISDGLSELVVYNAVGQNVYVAKLNSSGGITSVDIDVRSYPSGLYYLHFLTPTESKTLRFEVE